jgi:glutaredoxin 3
MSGRLAQLTGANAVVIFSWVRCPFCVKAKALLGGLSNDVAIYDIDQMADGNALHAEIIKATNGHDTVPAIWVKNEFVGGFSDVDALHKQGKLTQMLAQ